MRCQLKVLVLLLYCLAISATGQEETRGENQSYVVIPNERILLVIASQPDAPVRFEEARLMLSVDGRDLALSYKLHNSGSKAIRHLSPIMWTSFNTGGTLRGRRFLSGANTGQVLLPSQTLTAGKEMKTVPFTAELEEKLKLRGTKAMVVLMVSSVTFVDGTTYNDDATLKATQGYFQELTEKMSRLESLEEKRE